MNAPLLTFLLALGTGLTSAMEVDPAFKAQVDGTIHAIARAPSGQIIIGGEFESVNGIARMNIARLRADGSLDAGFNILADGAVFCLAAEEDGAIYAGGAFNSPLRHIFRLRPDGQFDGGFDPGPSASSRIQCLGVAAGVVFAGGSFRSFDNSVANYIAKLTANGVLDTTFASGLSRAYALEAGAYALDLQTDGKIVLAGKVGVADDLACLVRLNSDGSLDASFSGDPGPILYPKCVLTLPDGKILVGGTAPDGKGFIRRLHANGEVDPGFSAPPFSSSIETFAIGARGQVFVGGNFDRKLARLNVDGTLDETWNIAANGPVKSIVFESNGDILVGGAFTEIGGEERRGIARVKTSASFRTFATNENGRFMARLEAEPGRACRVESSEDLRTWSDHSVVIATEAGVEFTDPALGRKHRFFRARLME